MPFGKDSQSKTASKYPLLTELEIDPNEFYVPQKAPDGDKSRIWAHIQPGHMRQLAMFAGSSDLPYRGSVADVVRHAVWRHLHWLANLGLPVRSVLGQADLIMEISRDMDYQIKFEDTFRTISSTVGRLMSAQHVNEARKYLVKCAGAIRDMPDGDWKEQYKRDFQNQFGPYLRTTGTTQLIGELDAPRAMLPPPRFDEFDE